MIFPAEEGYHAGVVWLIFKPQELVDESDTWAQTYTREHKWDVGLHTSPVRIQ
jgi:hypothetical protein